MYDNPYYYSDIEQGSEEKPHCCGQRYNISENKMENLYGYQLIKTTRDDFGFETREEIGEPQYYWKETKKKENGTYYILVDEEFSLPTT